MVEIVNILTLLSFRCKAQFSACNLFVNTDTKVDGTRAGLCSIVLDSIEVFRNELRILEQVCHMMEMRNGRCVWVHILISRAVDPTLCLALESDYLKFCYECHIALPGITEYKGV